MVWLVCLLILAAVILWSGKRFGPNMALAISSLVGLLFPFWVRVEPYGIEIHLNVAVGVAGLGYYLIHPKSVFRAKLILLDYLMIAMVLVNAISDVINSGWQPYILLQIYGEWFVAYVVGRLSLSEFSNVRDLQALASVVSVALAILAMIECYTSINILQVVFDSGELANPPNAKRWGFLRACGPSDHPIYFATLMFLLFPWVIQYVVSQFQKSKNPGWFLICAIVILGMFATISRAPILALGFLALGPVFILSKKARIPIAIASCCIAIALYFGQSQLIEMIENAGGEKLDPTRNQMVVDGKSVISSSARVRIYLFDYYATALRRAGLFGYGSAATAEFPPNVPAGGNFDLSAMKNLKWIDNQYLLFTLRFGYLGVACWVFALACTAWNFFAMSSRCPIDLKWFCACSASAIVGVMFIQMTVWMPQDYGFYLIWLMGGSAGLMSAVLKKKRLSVERDSGLR